MLTDSNSGCEMSLSAPGTPVPRRFQATEVPKVIHQAHLELLFVDMAKVRSLALSWTYCKHLRKG